MFFLAVLDVPAVVLASLFARLPLNINALNYPMEDIVFSVSFIDVSFLV